MNIVVSDLAHLIEVWDRVVAYKGEGLMDKMWRGMEEAISGVEEVLAVVGMPGGAGSVMGVSGGKQKLQSSRVSSEYSSRRALTPG